MGGLKILTQGPVYPGRNGGLAPNNNPGKGNDAFILGLYDVGYLDFGLGILRDMASSAHEVLQSESIKAFIGECSPVFTKVLQGTSKTLQLTKVIAFTKIFFEVPKCVRQVVKVTQRRGSKQFDHLLKALFAATITADAIGQTFSGLIAFGKVVDLSKLKIDGLLATIETAAVWAYVFGAVSGAVSAVSFVIHVRSRMKTEDFLEEFTNESGYDPKGYTLEQVQQNYLKFKDYFTVRDPESEAGKKKLARLERYFQVNPSTLSGTVLKVFPNGINNREDCEKFEALLNRLKERLETNKKQHTYSAVIDLISVIGAAIILANVWNPAGFVVLGVVASLSLGNTTYKKINTYNFESEIGMIQRSKDDPLNKTIVNFKTRGNARVMDRTLDFCKWFFGIESAPANPPSTGSDDSKKALMNALSQAMPQKSV